MTDWFFATWRDRDRRALLLLCTAYTLWALWMIWRSSFDIDGQRTFCLWDDAMTSMTYARNLVDGRGFNWARFGEPVEGFTHPLWTFLMVAFHLLPVGINVTSLFVQLTSLVCVILTLVAMRRLILDHLAPDSRGPWLPAAFLTAFYYPFNFWSLMGMETAAQTLLILLSIQIAFNIVHKGTRQFVALSVVLATSVLLRLDMIIFVIVVVAFMALHGAFTRATWRQWRRGVFLFVGALVAYQVFRLVVFHDFLPNTYYLKLTGTDLSVRIARGFISFAGWARPYLLIFLLLGAALVSFARANRKLLLPIALVVAGFAYAIYVGGDAWEALSQGKDWEKIPIGANRFVSVVMPLVFILLSVVLGPLSERIVAWAGESFRITRAVPLSAATIALALIFNQLWLSDHADDRWRRVFGIVRGVHVGDHRNVVVIMKDLKTRMRPDAMIATVWAGIPSYFSDFRMADILGYNDRVVAKMPAPRQLTLDNADEFHPGHMKWDYDRLLGQLKPDLVLSTWGLGGLEQAKMSQHGYVRWKTFWIRSGSPNFVNLN